MSSSREVDVVFVFADLSGYTALTEAHGGSHAADVVTRYLEIAGRNLEPGARIVERVGDEVLIIANEASAAVKTAIRLRDSIAREPLFPMVRAGIHGGRVVETSEGYFGSPLNLAARVAAYARGGQLLCTKPIAHAAARLPDVEIRGLGPVRFKNVSEPVEVFVIDTPRSGEEGCDVDPVCHMQVRAESAPARLPYGTTTYYFCSFACARKFAASPESYVG
jgi:adenylate cyclase